MKASGLRVRRVCVVHLSQTERSRQDFFGVVPWVTISEVEAVTK